MTDIDYEKLAKAWRQAGALPYDPDNPPNLAIRAVVVALRDQGLVIVSEGDLRHYLIGTLSSLPKEVAEHPNNVELFTRIATAIGVDLAALAAPGNGGNDG